MPKLLKNDVRRTYAEMFATVYNSCDPSLMRGYLDAFHCKDFAFQQHCSPEASAQGKSNYEILGADAVLCFWTDHVCTTPDLHLTLGSTTLRVRSDLTAVLEFQFVVSGFVVVPDHMDITDSKALQTVVRTCDLSAANERATGLQGPHRALPFTSRGTAFMHLDSDTRVSCLRFLVE